MYKCVNYIQNFALKCKYFYEQVLKSLAVDVVHLLELLIIKAV